MAELLGTHAAIGPEVDDVPEGEIWCNNIACGFKMRASDYDYDDMQDFAAHQAEILAANSYGKLEPTRFVLAEREAELLNLKGPCRAPQCRLHHAHQGPCDTRRPE